MCNLQLAKMREAKERKEDANVVQREDFGARVIRELSTTERAECNKTNKANEEARRQAKMDAKKMVERMENWITSIDFREEYGSTARKERMYERERKDEKERLARMLKDLEVATREEIEMDLPGYEETRRKEEEKENVRMVQVYMEREAHAAARLEQRRLERDIGEFEKTLDLVHNKMLKQEAENALTLEEEKRKVRINSSCSYSSILNLSRPS